MTASVALYSVLFLVIRILKFGLTLQVLSAWPLFLGLLFGSWFIWIDRIVYAYLYPKEPLSIQLSGDLKAPITWPQRFARASKTLRSRKDEQKNLFTQHILFGYGTLVLAFFGVTSTAGWFGKGIVLGISLQLALKMIDWLRGRSEHSTDSLFWPIKRDIPLLERRWMVGIYLVGFLAVTLIV